MQAQCKYLEVLPTTYYYTFIVSFSIDRRNNVKSSPLFISAINGISWMSYNYVKTQVYYWAWSSLAKEFNDYTLGWIEKYFHKSLWKPVGVLQGQIGIWLNPNDGICHMRSPFKDPWRNEDFFIMLHFHFLVKGSWRWIFFAVAALKRAWLLSCCLLRQPAGSEPEPNCFTLYILSPQSVLQKLRHLIGWKK